MLAKWPFLLLICASAFLVRVKSSPARLKEVTDSKFAPGQVWSYKTRPGEENSTLTVLRIESDGNKTIVHIAIENVRMRNCTGGPEPDKFEHMPFAREALDQSVVSMLKKTKVPDYEAGYSEWRKGWDAGKAGVYTISVAAALDVSQATFDQGLGCSK
jgi:hypothetical protein